ncbi:hypothetical protein [Rhizorhabdus argentea]|uniref:hypothetical protein n=1 Tax=Rhizorhabdus argentea TaxID=1387174 RepID=UPI0030EB9031
MTYRKIALLSVFCLAAACNRAGSNPASIEENPSSVIPSDRLADSASAGNGTVADPGSGATAVDPQSVGASAPGAGTSGPAGAGQATGSSDGGRSLGDR